MERYPKIKNSQFDEIFNKIADLLEIKGEIIYKILAYRRAAEAIRDLEQDVMDYWKNQKLTEIPGVGKAISEKINEFIQTGKIEFLEKLKEDVPESLIDLLRVPDLGPKKVSILWKKAGISTLEELEHAASSGKLRDLDGFGEKTEKNILRGLEALASQSGRIAIAKAWLFGTKLVDYLQ